jgi:ribosome biogenesis GTPase A
MSIQWFPGHMHKARLQIKEAQPRVDLFVEILDARIPFSSQNPLLTELRGNKPCVKVLNKSDLADPELTKTWLDYFNREEGIKAVAVTTTEAKQIRRLGDICVDMCAAKQAAGKIITGMIVGIPNVGKSSIINLLAGRKVARTGNEPAVTKGQQRIKVDDGFVLLDTPGVMWPNVENRNSGYRLAVTGAIKETAMDYPDVANFLAGFLLEHFPDALMARYEFDEMPEHALQVLDMLGKKRGCLRKGGIIDYDRVSSIFVNELKAAKFGRLTLETPELMEAELAALKIQQGKTPRTAAAKKKKKKSQQRDRAAKKKFKRRK